MIEYILNNEDYIISVIKEAAIMGLLAALYAGICMLVVYVVVKIIKKLNKKTTKKERISYEKTSNNIITY